MSEIVKKEKNSRISLNMFQLKMIALITMTIDHIGAALLPQYLFLRVIGRISFPIYCFVIVVGFCKTSNVWKYLLRLVVFACISEIFFDLAFFGKIYYPNHQNVFFTLFLGLFLLILVKGLRFGPTLGVRIINYVLEYVCVVLICGISIFMKTDYTLYGILMIYFFFVLQYNKFMQGIFIAFVNMQLMGGIQTFATISLIPIFMYNGEKGNDKFKKIFYLYYPLHLLVIFILECAI